MGEKMLSQNKLIAVAIDKDRGSQIALKWTVDNLLVRGQTVLLIHVKSPPLGSPISGSNQIYDEAGCRKFSELDLQTKEMFLPFRGFCTRKDVESHVVVLEDKDIVKAIVEYVNRTGVEALILGAARKDGLLRFRAKDIPGDVLKGAPDFCTVHIISKYGKIVPTRPASRPAPFVHPPPHQSTSTEFANSRGRARNQEMEEIKRELQQIRAQFVELEQHTRRARNHEMEEIKREQQQIRAQFVELEQHTRTIKVMLSELYETIGRNQNPYSATPSSPPPPPPPPPRPVFLHRVPYLL